MRNFIWTVAAIIVAWFVTLTINRNLFLNTNIDPIVQGTTIIANTDIGTRCGSDVNKNEVIEYKLSAAGKIIYLCPLGFWPVQKEIVAVTLTPDFRRQLNPAQLAKIKVFYPEAPAPVTQSIPAQ